MSSLKADFNELLERIRHGRDLGHASYEPIYYLIFPPRQILDVKRQLPAWIAKLKNDGWDVRKYEKRLEGLEPAPTKQLTGVELWQYLERKHGYRNNA